MLVSQSVRPGARRFLFVFSVLALLIAALPVEAQTPPGGGRRRGGPPKGGPNPAQNQPQDLSTGSQPGWIVKYKPAKEKEGAQNEGDDDLIGELVFKPQGKNAKTMTLKVKRSVGVLIELGSGPQIEPEQYGDVLVKGLFCTAGWKPEEVDGKESKTKRDLTRVSFSALEVKGKIFEIGDEFLVLKVKPANEADWPDKQLVAPTGSGGTPTPRGAGGGGPAPKAKPIAFRKLKLKIYEDVTKYLDAEQKPLDATDFEKDQSIEASVVYGKKEGIVLALRSPTAASDSGEEGTRGGRKAGPISGG